MTTLGKGAEKTMKPNEMQGEMQEEMVGILTAISIVSKRLAGRLLKNMEREEVEDEQN